MSSSGNSGGSSSSNTPSTPPSTDSGSSSSSSGWEDWGYITIAVFVVIGLVLLIYVFIIKRNPDFLGFIGYAVKNFVGISGMTFINFLPTIFMMLGPMLDLINYEFQASKITIASLIILFGQSLLGLILTLIKGFIGSSSGTQITPVSELIPNFINSCRINGLGFSFPASTSEGVSNYTTGMMFISLSYMLSLALIQINNSSASFPNWWVGPLVMSVISIIGSIIRINTVPNCDSGVSWIYGVAYSLIWVALFFGVGLGINKSIVPFNNRIFPQSSSSLLGGATKPNTTQSCAVPTGEGAIYEIYQDGEMIGQI